MMKRRWLGMLFSLGMASSAISAGDYLLYTPQKTDRQVAPANPAEGVLVQSIVIRKGDTLKKIAKRHVGKGSYFPQILLFNSIANPDLIHAGHSILVPVSEKGGTSHRPLAKSAKKRGLVTAKKKDMLNESAELPLLSAPANESYVPGDRMLFEKGFTAYRKGDYRKAIALFDQLTARYPSSIFAPDAALCRAESYLKLSGESR